MLSLHEVLGALQLGQACICIQVLLLLPFAW